MLDTELAILCYVNRLRPKLNGRIGRNCLFMLKRDLADRKTHLEKELLMVY